MMTLHENISEVCTDWGTRGEHASNIGTILFFLNTLTVVSESPGGIRVYTQ